MCVPSVQVPSSTGGRIVMASDGLWDAVSSERAAKCSRGMPASTAAPNLVKVSAGMEAKQGTAVPVLVA